MAVLEMLLPARPVRIDLDSSRPFESSGSDAESSFERYQLLDAILALNPTATADFLTTFSTNELAEYRQHLLAAREPRGRAAVWVRPRSSRGICWSSPRE